MSSKSDLAFSVVIPVFNEELNISELYRRLSDVMNNLCHGSRPISADYEILFVDDGSSDRSWSLIENLHKSDCHVNGLRLSRNFGQHIAITAGIEASRGNSIVIMDGDLQDPPEELPKLVDEFIKGYDHVYAIRSHRCDALQRRFFSRLFWIVFKHLMNLEIAENQSMLRIMSRRFADAYRRLTEKNRFLAGLFAWLGFRQSHVLISHSERLAGRSKYGLSKMIKLTFHAITSFSYLPLQFAGFIGTVIASVSFVIGLILIFQRLALGIIAEGWTSLIVSILFMGGVQLAFLGLLGEYIGRIFAEVQNRPLYLLSDQLIHSRSEHVNA